MKRIYEALLVEHLRENRQMAFVSGPRQVGKTTTCRIVAGDGPYLTWDDRDERMVILRGPKAVAERLGLQDLRVERMIVVFDELHKYAKWKNFLKGLFDLYGDRVRIVVTGSSRLDVFKRGGDSLMGRYFPYRMHPLSVAETLHHTPAKAEIRPPTAPGPEVIGQLLAHGGFPEPFLKGEMRFTRRWRSTRSEQLLREDLRDLTRVQELDRITVLAELLTRQAGQLVNYTTLANRIDVSVDTIRRWITILESVYFCFKVRPWFRNVASSLRKQPKIFLWDWGAVSDEGGARFENLIAAHLLKAVHWWTDSGLGSYGLHFLRDKTGREVDFLVTRDDKPWFLVEAKRGDRREIHSPLSHFQSAIAAPHAFQVSPAMPYVARDCFAETKPVRVPASTFLSQLV